MRLQAGETYTLTVAREVSPYGYFLSDGNQDVLLHYSEVTDPVDPGNDIEVFLFHDTEDRLAATMHAPLIHFGEVVQLEVVDIHPRLGCFMEMGIRRHLLLPFSELPELDLLRPQVGDQLYVKLDRDKQGRMVGKLAQEPELRKLAFSAPDAWMNHELICHVYKTLKAGSFVVCGAGKLGFGAIGMIHASERTKPLRVGEHLRARVTYVRADGRVNLSMRPVKEVGREEHAEAIYTYLQGRSSRSMPYSDQTSAEIIRERFDISKSAF